MSSRIAEFKIYFLDLNLKICNLSREEFNKESLNRIYFVLFCLTNDQINLTATSKEEIFQNQLAEFLTAEQKNNFTEELNDEFCQQDILNMLYQISKVDDIVKHFYQKCFDKIGSSWTSGYLSGYFSQMFVLSFLPVMCEKDEEKKKRELESEHYPVDVKLQLLSNFASIISEMKNAYNSLCSPILPEEFFIKIVTHTVYYGNYVTKKRQQKKNATNTQTSSNKPAVDASSASKEENETVSYISKTDPVTLIPLLTHFRFNQMFVPSTTNPEQPSINIWSSKQTMNSLRGTVVNDYEHFFEESHVMQNIQHYFPDCKYMTKIEKFDLTTQSVTSYSDTFFGYDAATCQCFFPSEFFCDMINTEADSMSQALEANKDYISTRSALYSNYFKLCGYIGEPYLEAFKLREPEHSENYFRQLIKDAIADPEIGKIGLKEKCHLFAHRAGKVHRACTLSTIREWTSPK